VVLEPRTERARTRFTRGVNRVIPHARLAAYADA
jgi:hypothetical protein